MKNGVAIGYVDDEFVLGYLVDEVSGVEIVAYWHAKAEDQDILKASQDLYVLVSDMYITRIRNTHRFNVGLGHRVKAPIKVRSISLLESRPPNRMLLIILIDTPSRKNSAMNTSLVTLICKRQSPDNIRAHGLRLVILAPIDVRSSCTARSVKNVRWLKDLKGFGNVVTIFHVDCCGVDFFALVVEEVFEKAGDPAVTAPDEEAVGYTNVQAACAICAVCPDCRHFDECVVQADRSC
jgi:hypothetical protein